LPKPDPPFGRPVDPEVYRISASNASSGCTVSALPESKNSPKPSFPVASKSIVRVPTGTIERRAASLKQSEISLSLKMYWIVAAGSL